MVLSKERNPDSICPIGMFNLAADNAPAKVELAIIGIIGDSAL